MAQTYLGAKIAIAEGLPATLDVAGFGAMSYTETDEGIVTIGALGDTNETVPVPDITKRRIMTLKGAATGDTTNVQFARKRVAATGAVAAGQLAFRDAAKAIGDEYSFRITEADGTVHYAGGPFMSWKDTGEMTTSSYASFAFDFANNTGIVSSYAAPE